MFLPQTLATAGGLVRLFPASKGGIEMPLSMAYAGPISFIEILEEIPKLSFAQRQELVRRAIALDDEDLTPEEIALLDARTADFQRNPETGIPLEQLEQHIAQRLPRR